MIAARREQSQRSMWPFDVVADRRRDRGSGNDGPPVALTEDQDAVGEFGSGCEHESFGEEVRSRTPRWDLHVDPGNGHDVVEGAAQRAGAVRLEPDPDHPHKRWPRARSRPRHISATHITSHGRGAVRSVAFEHHSRVRVEDRPV